MSLPDNTARFQAIHDNQAKASELLRLELAKAGMELEMERILRGEAAAEELDRLDPALEVGLLHLINQTHMLQILLDLSGYDPA